MTSTANPYFLPSDPSELERIRLQARVWEPAGRALITQLPSGTGLRALDVGCGMMGWLRILSEWVGPTGSVVGADYDEKMLAGARSFVETEALGNVELVRDDLFKSQLPPHSFDLVHARFQIAPLGRADEQLASYRRLLKAGGWLVLEDPDSGSWRINPEGAFVQRLIELICRGFEVAGGNFNAGRELPALFRGMGLEPRVSAHVVALEPGHPYLRVPLQFAHSMRPRLEGLVGKEELDSLLAGTEAELSRPEAWGTTFTVIQVFAAIP